MKRIFVVGGAGFIGSHLVRRLLVTPGVEAVTVYDNLSSGKLGHVPIGFNANIEVEFIKGDARDYDRLRTSMQGAETVFHLAANPDISRAVTEPTIDFEQGTVLLKNSLEAARVNAVTRFLYFSGSGVYGDTENPTAEWYGPMEPISTYGASKLGCEAMISSYCHMFGMQARAFRFANVVGPRQTHGVGYDFLRRLRENHAALRILGDGTQRKSYIYVQDVLTAVFMVIARTMGPFGSARPYDVYNVATGDSITVTEIAEMACRVLALDPTRVKFEYTGGDRGWKGDVPKTKMDCAKIHALGWQCGRSSADAMDLALFAMRSELEGLPYTDY